MAELVSNDFEFDISQEFIESGTLPIKKRGGPYSKNEKIKRQNEVHRLHFEYGYSARKIAEMMNINRNTINGDIDYMYGKIIQDSNVFDPEPDIILYIQRMNIQRTRLRESLDKAENFQQRNMIEKMIFDIDCKIINTQVRLAESMGRLQKYSIEHLNEWLKKNNKDIQYMNYSDTISVSKKAKEKISKIIKEDRIRR